MKNIDYINHVHHVCNELDITVYDYFQLRRLSNKLNRLYTDDVNGVISEADYNKKEKRTIYSIEKIVSSFTGVYSYYQTDPRGASLYLGRDKLTSANYSNGCAIY